MSKEFAKKWLAGVAIFIVSCLFLWCMTLGFEIVGIWLLLAMIGAYIVCLLILLIYALITTVKAIITIIRKDSSPPDTIYEVTCACGNAIEFDYETLEKGFIICDKCGEHLEFHCEDT